jgi:hypothetical protein
VPSSGFEAKLLQRVEFSIGQHREVGVSPQRVVGIALDGERRQPGLLAGQKLFEDAGDPSQPPRPAARIFASAQDRDFTAVALARI